MTTAKKDMENTKDADAVGIESTALFGILRYVANECQKHPSDSVKDIVNEAFDDYGLPFYAEWSDNDDQPISILPNKLVDKLNRQNISLIATLAINSNNNKK